MASNASSEPPPSFFPDLSPSPPTPDPHPLSDQPTSFVPIHASPAPVTNIRGTIDANRITNRVKRQELEKRQQESILACDAQIKAFVQCATGRTFSTVWACRGENGEMHTCMAN